MTVARVTKTACSDRCRKQWIGKGAEVFPHLRRLLLFRLAKIQITVKDSPSRLSGRVVDHQFSLICAG